MRQQDLFDNPPVVPSISQAQRAADVGMKRAVEHADRVEPDWSERALGCLQQLCLLRDEFTAEEAREVIHQGGLPMPTDGRAWGAVFKKAAMLGWIHKVGYAPRRCGNMTPTIIWRTDDGSMANPQ